MFRLEIDAYLSYGQIADALRRFSDALLECKPEQGDNGTLTVDGLTVGTWRVE